MEISQIFGGKKPDLQNLADLVNLSGARKDNSGTILNGGYGGRFTKFVEISQIFGKISQIFGGKKPDLQNLADLVNLSGVRKDNSGTI